MVIKMIIKTVLLVISTALLLIAQSIDKAAYKDKLRGFWLGSCIANWTGLQTEGHKQGKPYYTDDDWSSFGYVLNQNPWGSDDDTDIEYIFWHAMETYRAGKLTGEQIRDEWLEHIDGTYIWVSNESAYKLMRDEDLIPPATSLPANNTNWEMIDAQLVTESFGLMAPANPQVALDISYMPIRTMAYSHSMYAAQFYVVMHSLASSVDTTLSFKDQLMWMADSARTFIPDSSYISKMYDWVKAQYLATTNKDNWEKVRDAFHDRYVEGGADSYRYQEFYDCGVNFGFSIISLLFGEGDFKRTIKIGTLSGMDSDNPTATWGGLLGFMYGDKKLGEHFGNYNFSDNYNIARTRIGFGGTNTDQYDTYVDGTLTPSQYIGYTFGSSKTFSKLVFQEGMHFLDGGWFSNGSLKVQVRNGTTWANVSANVTPAYPDGNDSERFGSGFETYTFELNTIQGNGIRISGNAGGSSQFISVAELQVFENNTNIASQGTIVATVTAPNGGGNKNIEIIRDGKMPRSSIDSFSAMTERGLAVIDSVVKLHMGGTVTASQWNLSPVTAVRGKIRQGKRSGIPSILTQGKNITVALDGAFPHGMQSIQLFDLNGKLLSEGPVHLDSRSNRIHFRVQSSGLYLVQCGSMASRIVVK
jgi:hypothetical protein